MKSIRTSSLLLVACLAAQGQAVRTNEGFRSNSVPRNDDGSSALQSIGFTVNFFGQIRTHLYVNNNGNLTFDAALSTFTPFGLENTRREIIAAFFADVDTRPVGSALVTFGRDTVNGRPAFGANFVNVGYYNQHTDKLNSFQIVLIERGDTGFGNFDIEFNYDQIAWETGDASNGVNGFGGTPASAGYSNGTGQPGTSFELEGSLVSSAFLDGGYRSLTRNRLNSPVRGRYVFRARDGQIVPPLTMTTGCPLPTATFGVPYAFQFGAIGTGTNTRWAAVADPNATLPPGLNFSSNGLLSGTPSAVGNTEFTVRLSSTLEDGEQVVSRRCSVAVEAPRLSITTACPLPSATVNQAYSRTLQAAGGRAPYQWSLTDTSSPLPPGMALSSAGVLSGLPTAEGSYRFELRAAGASADAAEPATKFCTLSVNPAVLNLTTSCSLPAGTTGVPYSQTLQVDGGSGPFTWTALSSLPPGLSLSPAGRISGSPLEPASVVFNVQVTDARGQRTQQACRLQVQPPVLEVTTACPLPPATTGAAYSQTLQVTGGDGPYTFAPLSGLPNGLNLSSDGTLSGTPGAAGPYGFRVLVTDSHGRAAVRGCTLSIMRASFGLTSCPLPDAVAGAQYSRFLTADGGLEPYTFTASGVLPSGLSLTTAGHLAGTPTTPGSFPLRLQILDRNGRSVNNSCVLTVQPSPLQISGACPAPTARVGTPYNVRYTAEGGTSPYTFSTTGSLPAGLSMSRSGAIQGTPTLATTEREFVIRVTDALNRASTLSCSIDAKLPEVPSIRIAPNLPASVNPASAGPTATIELGSPYSLPIEGTLRMTVEPNTGSVEASVNRADPRVRFNNGQQSINFTIAPGQRQVSFPIASTGTVASNVVLSVTNIRAGGSTLPSVPAPRSFAIRRTIPVITDACFTAATAAANAPAPIQVTVTGYSTTRSLRSATVTLNAATGGGTQTRTVDVSGSAQEYFATDEAIRNGGAFMLTIPFDIFGASVNNGTLTLTNSEGTTASRTLNRCQ